MSTDDDDGVDATRWHPREGAFENRGRKLPPMVRMSQLASTDSAVELPSSERFDRSLPPRILVDGVTDWGDTLLPQLSPAALAAAWQGSSVFVEVAPRVAAMSWPLVLAPLDDGASALMTQLFLVAPNWIHTLARVASDADQLASIAIAIEPSGDAQARRATVAIAFSAGFHSSEELEALARRTDSAITAFTEPSDPVQWLIQFIAELSHDWPLDIAFQAANRQSGSPWAVMYGNPEDLERSRISAFATRALRAADTIHRAGPPIDLDSLANAMTDLDVQLGRATWDSERGDASDVVKQVELLARMTKMQSRKPANGESKSDAESRRLSAACVSGEGASKRARPTAPLAPGADGFVEVDVRAPEHGRAAHPTAIPDIVSQDPDEDEFEFDVFWIDPELGTQSGALRLPRSGASNRKVFRYRRPATSAKLMVTVVLVYAQRLVQAGEFEIDADDHTVRIRDAVFVARTLEKLSARSDAPATATITSDGTHTHSLERRDTEFVEGMYTFQANKVSACLLDALGTAASTASTRGELDAEGFRKLLVNVACAGVILRDQIKFTSVREADHVQLIERSAGTWLPIEFAYDHDAPNDDARVCDRVMADTATRGCDATCRARTDGAHWVCPRAFWGTSKTIERWALGGDSELPASTASRPEPLVFCAPTGKTKQLDLSREWVAAFSRLVAEDTQKTIEALCAKTNGGASSTGWAGVEAIVSRSNPGLHIVLAHHEKATADGDWDALEVDDDLRITPRINRSVVGGTSPPLVLLLACNSLAPDAGVASPVRRYLDSGAGAVVATTTLVWAPVVARVVFGLARALNGTNVRLRLGEWLRRQRLELLLQRDATAFSLVAYGDAEWELVGADFGSDIPDGAPSRDVDDDALRPRREKKPAKRRATANA